MKHVTLLNLLIRLVSKGQKNKRAKKKTKGKDETSWANELRWMCPSSIAGV